MASAREQDVCVGVDSAIDRVLSGLESVSLTEEQRTALKAFLEGNDVLCFLPETELSRSLVYQLAPLVEKELGRKHNPIFIIISPSDSQIPDQILQAGNLGVTATQLGGKDRSVLQGRYQLLFGSPESWLGRWRSLLSNTVYRENLAGIVVQEIHAPWEEPIQSYQEDTRMGADFRESFARLVKLRSIAPEGTPVLVLTGSANIKDRRLVTNLLDMENATEVTVSPNRTNVRLALRPVPAEDFGCMDWIVRRVRDKGASMAPIIIYCRSAEVVGKLFCHLKAELGDDAWVDRDNAIYENYLIGIFHSATLQKNKDRVLRSLDGQGSCRVVVATTALGMGKSFPNVSHVVMYGSPRDVEGIVQQVSRAGRNGLESHAILYSINPASLSEDEFEDGRTIKPVRESKVVKELLETATQSCFRKALYSHFEEHTTSVEPGHSCCTFCHSVCSCSSQGCGVPTPEFELLEQAVSVPLKTREVTAEDKTLIRDILTEYKHTLLPPNFPLVTSAELCTGFGTGLIEAVVEHSPHIFDLSYINDNLPVFRRKHAKEILLVMYEVFDDFEYVREQSPSDDDDSFTEPDINFTGYFDGPDEDSDEEVEDRPISPDSAYCD